MTSRISNSSVSQSTWQKGQDYSLVFWILMIGVLLILVGLPLFWLVLRSFQVPEVGSFTLNNYVQVLTETRLLQSIGNSLILATGVGILSVLIGVPMAWAVARTNMPLRGLMRILLLVVFATPPFLDGFAWILLASPNAGWLNRVFVSLTGAERGPLNIYSMWGAIFAVGICSYPYVFLLVSSALDFVSSELEDAATVLGSGKFKTALRITFPLVLPSIISGFLLTFLETLALFGSPTLILIPARIPIITTEIWQLFQFPANVELAAAFAISLIVITLALLALQRRLLGRKSYTTLTGKGGRKRLIDLGPWKWAFLGFCLLVTTLSLLLPYFILLQTSLSKAWGRAFGPGNVTLSWYEDVLFRQPFTVASIQNTLLYAAGAACLGLLVGVAIAYIAHNKLLRGSQLFGFLAMAPQVIPGIVIAIGLFAAYSRPPLLFYGTAMMMILAFSTRFLPIAYTNASNIFKSINPELELAARNLGASQVGTVRRITLPLVKRGLIGAWILMFVLSVREISSAILLFTQNTQVISTVMFELINEGSMERVSALGIVMLAIIFFAVGLAYRFLGRDFMLEKV